MIRCTVRLFVVVLGAACFACAQLPPPSPAPPPFGPSPVRTTLAICPDKSKFLDHVRFVANGLPSPSTDPNTPPVAVAPGTGTPISHTPYEQALDDAFQMAPKSFRDRLCGLTGIYINGPTNCSTFSDCIENSWGFRVWPSNTYIAIAAGLWNRTCPDGSTYVYHCFETDLLNAVFGLDPSNSYAPKHGPANPEADNFDMTILAALAHEVGHVRWYEVMTPDQPGVLPYDPNKSTFCGQGSHGFFSYSWVPPVAPPPPWREFAARTDDRHSTTEQISTIDRFVIANNLIDAAFKLDQLYQDSAPWASYFSAISPDEDFVETYKFYVLTNAEDLHLLLDNGTMRTRGKLTSLPISINSVISQPYKEDITDAYTKMRKPDLTNKTNCIAKII